MGGGGGGSQTYTKGYRYYMSILMGLGVGPIDEVTSISIGDKKAWTGSLADINTINIDKGNLFGGESGEGGIVGTVWAFFGAKAQVIPQSIKSIMGSNAPAPSQFGPFSDWLNEFNIPLQQIGFWEARRQYEEYVAQQQALSASAVPDFRGVATLFFDGMVCAINPYPKTWKVRRNRRQAGWDGAVWQPSLANIDMVATVSIEDTDDNGNGLGTYSDVTDTIKAMNPAHIIYQALTDRNFGRGYPRAMLDEIGFLACAQQLKAEGFGLCYDWDAKNTSIADFIGAIVNTIGAALRVDRVSGLITLKLIRDDYVAEMLPVFDRNSGLLSVDVDQSDANGSEINEQIVSYYDPISDEIRQVRAQNLGSMQSLGFKNTNTTSYEAIPTAALAGRVASRDLKIKGTSLRKYTLVFDRRAWRISVGDVVRVSMPERNIENIVIRIGTLEDTSLTDGKITCKGVLDVFGLPSQSYLSSTATNNWVPPPSAPLIISTYKATEISYRDAIRSLGADELAKRSRYETGYVGYAAKPGSTSLSFSTIASVVSGAASQAGSESEKTHFTSIGILSEDVNTKNTSFNLSFVSDPTLVQEGQTLIIDDEVMRVDSWNSTTGDITVSRGCVDSIPEAHKTMAVSIFGDTGASSDAEAYSTGSVLQVKFLTQNMNTATSTEAAPSQRVVTTGRQGRPWCPGNVQVNGNYFSDSTTQQGDVRITWSLRNRIITQDVLNPFTSTGSTQEASVSTIIELYRDGAALKTLTFDSGETSWTWLKEDQITDLAANPIPKGDTALITGLVYSRFNSEDAGDLDSWKKVPVSFHITPALDNSRVTEALYGRRDQAGAIRLVELGGHNEPQNITIRLLSAKTALADVTVSQPAGQQYITVPRLASVPSIGTVTLRLGLVTRLLEDGSYRELEDGSYRYLEDVGVPKEVTIPTITVKTSINGVTITAEQTTPIQVPTITAYPAISAPILISGLRGKTMQLGSVVLSGTITNKPWG